MSRREELLAFADTVKGFMPRNEGLALHRLALEHASAAGATWLEVGAVSYTHLDVYKRQR